jgi:hypothetical protein
VALARVLTCLYATTGVFDSALLQVTTTAKSGERGLGVARWREKRIVRFECPHSCYGCFRTLARFRASLLRSGPEHLSHWPAIDGLEAVQKAEELRRDVILLDIGLPKLHGIEATLQIQQRASDSAILILERNLGL